MPFNYSLGALLGLKAWLFFFFLASSFHIAQFQLELKEAKQFYFTYA
jgi:hypothetical protein